MNRPDYIDREPYRLTRNFSIASLIGIVLVTAGLYWSNHQLAINALTDHETRANADLARAFSNTVWSRYRQWVVNSSGATRASLLADPVFAQIDNDVRTKMRGLNVAKLKIYNADGLTVYSSDPNQVGESKHGNAGFLAAMNGRRTSHMTYRDRFDAFEGEIPRRDLISTYIPLAGEIGGATEAVIELYSDVTDLIHGQRDAEIRLGVTLVASLGALYIFLFYIVRRADSTIRNQHEQRREDEERIRHQAYHDTLTGLPNRAFFNEWLQEALLLAVRHHRQGALLFIDLDRFKIVNDGLGHSAGDELLTIVTRRINGCLRKGDLLFRMGGDEFTVILPEVDSTTEAGVVASRIIDAVSEPTRLAEHDVNVSASIGIAIFPSDSENAESIVMNADAAMYNAKASGRNAVAFYQPALGESAMSRLGIESALRRALRAGEFELHYQPRLDTMTEEVVAVEALLRWRRPEHGLVPPAEFLGVLEESGLMPMVDDWVLKAACDQLEQWHQSGVMIPRVSVNVSASRFQAAGFPVHVATVLSQTGVSPEQLELELTESALVSDPAQARETVALLRAQGVRIAIDDFGTGYSSLSYLRDFEAHTLKIDRSFIADILSRPREQAIVSAIVRMASALEMTVVAEGVEEAEQAEFFREIEVGELQGYLFARPMPTEDLVAYVANRLPASVHEPIHPEECTSDAERTGHPA